MKKITKSKTVPPKKSTKNKINIAMNTSEIQNLIDFISKSNLNSVEIETKELKLKIIREPDTKFFNPPVVQVSDSNGHQQRVAEQPKTDVIEPTETHSKPKTIEIKSPMIGTFYRASNPDSQPLISLGDKIKTGQIVCIIEAMKLFNEIESEITGTVVQILVENASPVEYDQVLFLVEPD